MQIHVIFSPISPFLLSLNSTHLDATDHSTYLDVTPTYNLSWSVHIENGVRAAIALYTTLRIILHHHLPTFDAFFRSHL